MRSWLGRGKGLQFGITVCCLAAFVLFGYEQGVFGPILQKRTGLSSSTHPVTRRLVSLSPTIYNLGCMVGCVGESWSQRGARSELCTPTSRGRLVSAEVPFIDVGIVSAYWFNFGMSFVGGPIAWRLPIALQALFAILVIILVFALPESPRWLFNHGREAEAIETLCAVYDM
ncbi:hypothetical protein FALCPG4_009931 [Fusarium falciforme]